MHRIRLLFVFANGQNLRRSDFLPFEGLDCRPTLRQDVVVVNYCVGSERILLIGSEIIVEPFLSFVLLFLDDVENSGQTIVSFKDSFARFIFEKSARNKTFIMC